MAGKREDLEIVIGADMGGLANALREYLVGKPAGEPVWPGTWSERAADMLKTDAQAAGIALVIQTKDGPQVLDFHSLRGTFATLLDTIDMSPKARQELMRHSDPRLTMNRYTLANQSELDKAATRIPVTVPKPIATDSACTKLAQIPTGEGGSERATAVGNEISPATVGNGGGAEKQANRSDLQGVTPSEIESHLRDLNPGPPLYESGALPLC